MMETDAEYWMRRRNEAIAERDEAVRLLERHLEHSYNPFEPDNQSRLYNETAAYLAKVGDNVGGEARLAAHQPSQTTTATPQGVASTDQLGRASEARN